MSVVITGGAGFLGQRLARRLLDLGHLPLPDGTELLHPKIVLADRPGAVLAPDLAGRVTQVALDITDPAATRAALADAQAVFHLAAVVSGQAEAEFDLGMAVNLDGTRSVLEAARAAGRTIPVIGTSSLAVFGANVHEPLTEAAPTQPLNSYGAAKAMAEILMSDYRRKGFAEARSLRLPTIVVRPGAPNAAASSFASSIFREPLAGQPARCPVDPGLPMWLASPDTAVNAMVQAMTVPSADWPDFSALNVPGLTVTVAEMLEALADVGGAEARARVTLDPDPAVEAIVASWPAQFDTALAGSLGFEAAETSMRDILRAYLADAPA
ncbi:MAG: NAD-dependent epimerase/dehydratase family protein [Rhodobacteraceae bacterium]|nr:NAD-dependent epimerase/dehydratase family protein [Alphaproteobacteria bacterium]MBT8474784.1 NAD-dependent epimerase/dehydratase family protein [Alphaproteobacteria bacterium]NNF73085.1 NAD-dependent epimerase/dehydratase family protein [Paracoccaceae bacterium]NNK68134.1 NAD-dependent epimerase/dehydratase family protein [Paracoccaceae bacterium]